MKTGSSLSVRAGTALLATVLLLGCRQEPTEPGTTGPDVQVVPDEAASRVDVLVDGEIFTSYLYTDTLAILKKPVLHPLIAPNGVEVTRGYPLASRAGDRADHPHHIGLWFNYGDVNGLDFWNNSDAVPAERQDQMGTIRHVSIDRVESGTGQGVLEVTMNWLQPDGTPLLRENTRFVFHASPELRMVDRITTLTALDQRVEMKDNKEGVIGLRVTRALEHPSSGKVEVYDPVEGTIEVPGDQGATGYYISSEGIEGEDVWGTRGRWMMLQGEVDGDSVTVAMLDHPDNVGFPTYWHARGYGLFAANPLGQAALSDGKDTLNFALDSGTSTTFRHRIMLIPGEASEAQVESQYQAFTGSAN